MMPSLSSSLFILLVAYAFLTNHPLPSHSAGVTWKNVFILAGQSNMAGRGGVINDVWNRVVPQECLPNPSVFRFNKELEWEEAVEPLHRDIDVGKPCGIGPGLPFAHALLRNDPSSFGKIGLVPCAIGGTNLSQWARGSNLYNQMMKRTISSLLDGGKIRGMLWFQGESDTINLEDAESYKTRLKQFFVDVRTDLNLPSLPIFQVALASAMGRYKEIVREAQLGTGLPNVFCVDAKNFTLEPDLLHLSSHSQVRLGEMLAHAFLKTMAQQNLASILHNNVSKSLSYFEVNHMLAFLGVIIALYLIIFQ